MREDLRIRLAELGASSADMERVEAEGWLPLLALDLMLLPGRRRYDLSALASAAELDEDLARRLWRAIGFPDVPPGIEVFTDRDVDAARLARSQSVERDLEDGTLLQQVRVISGSLARIASVEADGFAEQLAGMHADDVPDEDIALAILADTRLADVGVLIEYLHRVQLRAAVWRRLVRAAQPDLAIAVGFADLSGYTELSAGLDADGLSDLVAKWEAVAYDTIAAHGARVVKTIGDEVMFVGPSRQVVTAAIRLQDAAAAAALPRLRIGAASGAVVARDGDFFGPAVNLASRLTEIARPGEILVPVELHDELRTAGEMGVRWARRGRRKLRSIGSVEVLAVEASG